MFVTKKLRFSTIAAGLCACIMDSNVAYNNNNSDSTLLLQKNDESNTGDKKKARSNLYKLKHVVVIMRHGDRAPVSKTIGPLYPNSKYMEDLWASKVVKGQHEMLLKGIARSQSEDKDDNIYTGRDLSDKPYGQLTTIGVEQIVSLGSTLRERYSHFLPAVLTPESLYTR